jgi:uncharacterized protein (DUF1778 family)
MKETRIAIRLSEYEKEFINKRARESGKPLSSYLREKVLREEDKIFESISRYSANKERPRKEES